MVDRRRQLRFWEGRRKRRSPDHPAVRGFVRPKVEIILRWLGAPLDRSRTMLEVGAGNGYFSVAFDERFALTALDFSRNMLEMNPLPWTRKIEGDAERLPFPDRSFDLAFCSNLLHHLPRPVAAVREMGRVARQHVVLVEPNIVNPLMLAFGLIKPEEWGSLKFHARYVKRLGVEAGLRLRHHCTQGAVLPNKTPTPVVPLLERIDAVSPFGLYHVAIFDVSR